MQRHCCHAKNSTAILPGQSSLPRSVYVCALSKGDRGDFRLRHRVHPAMISLACSMMIAQVIVDLIEGFEECPIENPLSERSQPALQQRDSFLHPPQVINTAGAHAPVGKLLYDSKIAVFIGHGLA